MSLGQQAFMPLPTDTITSIQVLDALAGGPLLGRAMMDGSRWSMPALAGANLSAGAPVQLAQVTGTATRSDFGGIGFPSGAASRLPLGAVRIGNYIVTANALMQQLQHMAERSQVEAAMSRFHLDRTNAAHILSARAYVWAVNYAPRLFWDVPYSGLVNERVAQAVGRFERDNPGTAGLSTEGNRRAQQAIETVVRAALAGSVIAGPVVIERRNSTVNPALSTYSARARKALGIEANRSWIAHHLLTFAGVARLPVSTQQAIAASGWAMDSVENLIALPANLAAYLSPFNTPLHPYHAGGHPRYNAQVDMALSRISVTGSTGAALRSELLAQELALRRLILSVAGQGMLK